MYYHVYAWDRALGVMYHQPSRMHYLRPRELSIWISILAPPSPAQDTELVAQPFATPGATLLSLQSWHCETLHLHGSLWWLFSKTYVSTLGPQLIIGLAMNSMLQLVWSSTDYQFCWIELRRRGNLLESVNQRPSYACCELQHLALKQGGQ